MTHPDASERAMPRDQIAEVVRLLGWAVENAWRGDTARTYRNMTAALRIMRDNGFDVKVP